MARTFKGVLRRWGSSTAVVVPPDVVRAEKIEVGEEVEVTLQRPVTFTDMFGTLPGLLGFDYLKAKEEDKRIERESERRKFGSA